jgi:hypothetical protein
VVVLVYIPTNSVRGFLFPCILNNTCCWEPPTFWLAAKRANQLRHTASRTASAQEAQGVSVTARQTPRAHQPRRAPTELQSLGLHGDVGSALWAWHVGNPPNGAWGCPMSLTWAALRLLQKPALASLFPFSTCCCPGNRHSVPYQTGVAKRPLISGILAPSLGLRHHWGFPITGFIPELD